MTYPKVGMFARNDVKWDQFLDDVLMEEVSLGLSFRQIAKRLGMTHDQVSGRFARLRKRMGWQAT